MTFVAQLLPTFSIEKLAVHNFINTRPWPVKNTSVVH